MSKLTRFMILAIMASLFLVTGICGVLNLHINWLIVISSVLFVGLIVAIYDINQKKHSLLRNYPLLGRLRGFFENERSKIHQYFIEDDTNGTPYDKEHRSDVYQKSKKEDNTTPFGTQLNVYANGYEFLEHSIYPKRPKDVIEPRYTIGNKFCKQPYSASIFNISAMSFGALSNKAIEALNAGAKLGNFFHNTGEGGLSPYHLQGGDICFQVGTGYFGSGISVNGERTFDDNVFKTNALKKEVKLIEIKLSQGAKPGHGGILPAKKNSIEIATIRNVEVGTEVVSPPYHTAFSDPKSMLDFINKLRDLSEGKPVGIKLCVGNILEFKDLCIAMKKYDTYPDFITVDGGEGGTGAAPLVFTNYVGMPLIDALIKVNKMLIEFGLRNEIKIIASGKASNAFDLVKLIALGANGVNAARAFMLSLGCIQARECNNNTCPVGITTQNPKLVKGLDPAEKRVRVYNYHEEVIHEVCELVAAAGYTDVFKIPASLFMKRVEGKLKNYL